MKRFATCLSWLCVVWCEACGGSPAPFVASEPIPGFPASQQRTISIDDFGPAWPFSVGGGRLACKDGALVFRSGSKIFAINEAARSLGFAVVDPIWTIPSPGPPRNPLKGILQGSRMQIFHELLTCDRQPATAASCRDATRSRHRLDAAGLRQIETEGREQFWPPLERTRRSLAPIAAAGLQLCK